MNYQAKQWKTIDLKVRSAKPYRNAFADVDVFGEFIAPSGKSIRVLGFYDGDETWVIRFAPTEVGEWHYRITSSDGENSDFSGEGTVRCEPYDGEIEFYRHGFLRVSDDKTYLEHADGTPFFWLGDTHWTFVTEEPYDDFKTCVDKRLSQRFTVYQCNFRDGAKDGYFGRSCSMMTETEDGCMPNLDFFHEVVDPRMDYLAAVGMVTAVGYAWGYDLESTPVERYIALAKYTMARYGAYPVIWTLAGELPGYMGDPEKIAAEWGKVAVEAAKWNAFSNLQSVHLACTRPFPKIYEHEPWFDLAMSQAGHGDFSVDQTMYEEFREMYVGHPIVESEGMYEGANSGELSSRPITPAMMRRLAYLIMQSGGCGYTYGALGVWEWQREAGVGGIGWGDLSWRDGLNLPGADQLTIFRDFYERVGFADLKPLSEKNTETKGFFAELRNRNKIYFTGNDDLTKIVGYVSETSMRNFTLRGLTKAHYTGYFMDPATGEVTEEFDFSPENGEWSYETSDLFGNRSDRVLYIYAS